MKQPTRIELFGSQTVLSVPIGLHPAYVPHAVLIALIVLAWVADGAIAAASWISGV